MHLAQHLPADYLAALPEPTRSSLLAAGEADGVGGLWVSPEAMGVLHPPDLPLLDLAANFSVAVAAWAAAGFPTVNGPTYQARLAICEGCAAWSRLKLYARCRLCGCSRLKLWLRTAICKLGKW